MQCGACWMPRSSRIDDARRRGDAAARPRARSSSATPARAQYSAIGTRAKLRRAASSPSRGVLGQERRRRAGPPRRARASSAREAERVGARAHLEVEVGELGRLGAARVDHDQRAGRVVGDRLQDGARAREAVRLPRVLADEHRDLGVLEVAGRVAARAAEELAVDPELAGLLLRERVRGVARRRTRRASRARSRRRGGCPARRRRSRRSTRRRARRGSRRAARRSRGSPCPSRSPRRCRRRGGAAAS